MDWGEAWRLTRVLMTDPSSRVMVALAGWDFPLSREGAVLADLYDLTLRVNSKKPPFPYPRPWGNARFGRTQQSQETVRANLRAIGHD